MNLLLVLSSEAKPIAFEESRPFILAFRKRKARGFTTTSHPTARSGRSGKKERSEKRVVSEFEN